MDIINCILLDLYQGARELPVPEFQELALALLKSVLRFDSGIWGAGQVTADAGLVIHTLHLHQQPEEWLVSYDSFKSRDHAVNEALSKFDRVSNFHFPDIDTGRENALNRLHCKKFATQNALMTSSLDPHLSSQDIMVLFRAKSSDRYGEAERCLAEFLMPHLIEAGKINRLFWLNQISAAAMAQRGTRGIAGLGGMLYTYDKAFVDIVQLEWPEWLPPLLPPELTTSIRASSARRFSGVRIVILVNLIGDMLFLRARQRSLVDTLTPAERTVADLVAHGQPYKEVARNLNVSLATVRNQLHSVYQKLGIRNKAELAQRLGEEETG